MDGSVQPRRGPHDMLARAPGQADGPDTGARLAVTQGQEPLRESEHGLGSQHAFGVRRTDG